MFAPDRHLNHHWQMARVAVVHQGCEEEVTHNAEVGQWEALPGEATLKDTLLTLPLFSLECGYLLYYRIYLIGPRADNWPIPTEGPHSRWPYTIPWRDAMYSWDLDIEGYVVLEDRKTEAGGSRIQSLCRVDGPGKMESIDEVIRPARDRNYFPVPDHKQ